MHLSVCCLLLACSPLGSGQADTPKSGRDSIWRNGLMLKDVYDSWSIYRVAQDFDFEQFGGINLFADPDYFTSKPIVVVGGQFSTGKTTMIQDMLLGKPYKGAIVGKAAAPNAFWAITEATENNPHDTIELGNEFVHGPGSPFGAFQVLNNEDVDKHFRVIRNDAPILKEIILMDTPGVLSSPEETRRYPIWQRLVQQADLVINTLSVTASNIDDNYKKLLKLYAHLPKERVLYLFNMADEMVPYEVLKAVGSATFHLGKHVQGDEAPEILVGSFWKEDCKQENVGKSFCKVFDANKERVQDALRGLRRQTPQNRRNQFIKFLDRLQIFLELVQHLKDQVCGFAYSILGVFSSDGGKTKTDYEELVDMAMTKFSWKPHMLPDKDIFAQQVLNAGGICNAFYYSSSWYLGRVKAARSAVTRVTEGTTQSRHNLDAQGLSRLGYQHSKAGFQPKTTDEL
eukprot:TRINITY_DN75477_c0_g1_i1.p1 TRINITY_DN75477_c0_g1~~TRINITY_DN75477_c0_g1_i1.p1  ORF type:complete len:457 (+),score=80.01 TRINITY_DN75477_c0_g1_i1:90-1460(+)